MEKLDLTDKLRAWGATHAQARMTRAAAAVQRDGASQALHEKASALEQRANALHREIYGQLDFKQRAPG
ncbi:hypothetical protein WG922_07580 [Ramlibacter sp. AN1015]|uniref:hypothetical protein n=1 Tax=Ramlibacter sp. AN1015 TaxID=3133428 RepID=UPI0030BE49DB